MRNGKVHTLTIILGLLIATAIVCGHVFQLEQSSACKQDQKTEQDADRSGNDAHFVTAPTITPPSSAQVHSSFLAHFLFVIDQPECEEETFVSDFNFHPRKFLLTLFRVIISPNAP
jgi:hypothetical protein